MKQLELNLDSSDNRGLEGLLDNLQSALPALEELHPIVGGYLQGLDLNLDSSDSGDLKGLLDNLEFALLVLQDLVDLHPIVNVHLKQLETEK